MGRVWSVEQLGQDWKTEGHTIHLKDTMTPFTHPPAVVLGLFVFTSHRTSLKPSFLVKKKNHFSHIGYLTITAHKNIFCHFYLPTFLLLSLFLSLSYLFVLRQGFPVIEKH